VNAPDAKADGGVGRGPGGPPYLSGMAVCLVILCLLGCFMVRAGEVIPANPGDPATLSDTQVLAQGRELATSGHRPEAIVFLQKRLEVQPGDSDARLLLGLVLSWDGQYDEARREIEAVLMGHPRYTDALLALVNDAIWSGHLEQADDATIEFLALQPNDVQALLARARLLKKMSRYKEATVVLETVHKLEPHNREAIDLRRSLREYDASWEVNYTHTNVWYSDHSSPWSEEAMTVKRGGPAGSVLARISEGSRWGYHSTLGEIDWYPHLRQGTYLYLNAGYSPQSILYPKYRNGAELFQSLGHGFEASAGYRWLVFSSSNIRVYTASVGRYHSDWYFSARTYLTPGSGLLTANSGLLAPGSGPVPATYHSSATYQFQARRYFSDGLSYVNVRYGHGAAPFEVRSVNEVGVLNSSSLAAQWDWRLGRHMTVDAEGGAASQDRLSGTGLWQYFFDISLRYRFE
jgi:tetratricopeptide (TPR) repeat protein